MTGAVVADPIAEETTSTADPDSGWKTILFNCECHTFDQVEAQLIKAVRCTLSRARRWAMEVHTKGSAVVCKGPRERCDDAAMTLAEIGLVVRVER